jgi:steroid delta-isomerase-like uncharacterized protein
VAGAKADRYNEKEGAGRRQFYASEDCPMNFSNSLSIQEIIDSLLAAWNDHDAERVSHHYADDYIGHDDSITTQQRGPDGVRASVQQYLNVFPDLSIRAEEIIASGNRAAVKVQVKGTQRGTILNIPPTGSPVEVRGTAFLSIRDGKICQASYQWDVAGFLRGIGLLPEL